jgi:hypothetical protein
MGGTCSAQSETKKDESQKFYRLDFVVKEVGDGKATNSRSYSTIFSTRRPSSIRTGSKVQYQMAQGQYQEMDVGVNIDCQSPREIEDQLALNVVADVRSVAPEHTAANAASPLLRNNKWSADVILPLRKATVIFSSDDPTSTHKMQVELTATPIR